MDHFYGRMTIDEFRATLSAAEPPAMPILLRAL